MALNPESPISSCWIATEGLVGLQNQAIGLAEALGISYIIKEIKKPEGVLKFLPSVGHDLHGPWPDLLITCGRQSVAFSMAARRASNNKTFTVHIQDPLIDPKHFDVVIVPSHDRSRGSNVFVTQGAIHRVTRENLKAAAQHFRPLLAALPRPLISVLIGGKNKHQSFSEPLAHDFARKLQMAATKTGGGLAISFSRRTGPRNEAIIRQDLTGVSAYIWGGTGENPYFGLLALAEGIVVTSDSISMISEAVSTGKPVYIYDLPNAGRRHKELVQSMIKGGMARLFSGDFETWEYTPLDETRKAADFVIERYGIKMSELKLNVAH